MASAEVVRARPTGARPAAVSADPQDPPVLLVALALDQALGAELVEVAGQGRALDADLGGELDLAQAAVAVRRERSTAHVGHGAAVLGEHGLELLAAAACRGTPGGG